MTITWFLSALSVALLVSCVCLDVAGVLLGIAVVVDADEQQVIGVDPETHKRTHKGH